MFYFDINMDIKNTQSYNLAFKGMNARPLKGIFMTSDIGGIASEIRLLRSKTGLDVFTLGKNGDIVSENFAPEGTIPFQVMWAQDLFSFTEKNLFLETEHNPAVPLIKEIGSKLEAYFGKKYSPNSYHLQGGNFINVETKGQKEILVGNYELKNGLSVEEIKDRFQVDRVHSIPQVAAHLDAFMFVDDAKRAFVCDDELTLKGIVEGILKIEEYVKNNFLKIRETEARRMFDLRDNLFKLLVGFQRISGNSPYAKTDEAVAALEKAGYKPIRIPGRVYQFLRTNGQIQHQYGTNFANAILHKNSVGDTVVITNASTNDLYFGLDREFEQKVGFSFKKMFEDSVAPYIKKENIHYIEGQDYAVPSLLNNLGGIHCASSEII